MTFKLRSAAGLFLSLILAGAATAFTLPHLPKRQPATAPSAPAAEAPAKPGQTPEWPQAHSDLAADSAIRFGVLPNGLRYAIMKNATPPGAASVRLRFDAGSLMETDAQQGLAHFLEHMAFNGSTHVPEGEMVKILERHGLSFGADTNAETTWNDTVYKLDLPKTDDDTVDTALMLLRETASELSLNQDAIDRERGVVLSEERSRDTPPYRIFKSRLGFIMPSQRPPQRFPIGKVDVITHAERAQIKDFYDRYYRPERAVLIIVGDVDPDAMEAKIKARFGDWRGRAPAVGDPNLGGVSRRGLSTLVDVEPGAPTSVQIGWTSPPDLTADSKAKRRRMWAERMALSVLNRRLASISRGDSPPFISAGAFRYNQFRAAKVTSLIANTETGAWKAGLSAVTTETRRAIQFGVRPEELAREIAETEAALKQAVGDAATRRSSSMADEIAQTLDEADVETSPADDLAFFDEVSKTLTVADVSQALKDAFTGSGPTVFLSAPAAIDGGEPALRTAFEDAQKGAVTASTVQAEVVWPYSDFGTPGTVAERREVPDLDTVFVRFANGVRLTVKQTKFRDDQVMVKVRAPGGLTVLPRDRQSTGWAGFAFFEGGTRRMTADDIERSLAGKVVGEDVDIDDDALTISGTTRRDDVDAQLQLFAAYASEPGWRPEALQRLKSYTANLLDQYAHTDSGVLGRDLPGLMHAGDRRWTYPSRADIDGVTMDLVRADLAPLTQAPLEVVIVGDITVDKAIEAVGKTFGALPARAEPPAPRAPTAAFPAVGGAPIIETHGGRADQAIGYVAWRTKDFYADPQLARNVAVLGEVMQLRLIDVLREGEGVTYSPNVGYSASYTWPNWGYISASVEVPPGKIDGFFADVAKIAADLRDHEVTTDELQRAKKPRMEQLEKSRQTNEYWLAALAGAQTDPRRLDAIRSQLPALERITAADVRRAAALYLGDAAAWKLVVKPQTP